ncbi:MAG: hypothetical protein IJ678_05205 [Kiritimatiellae bacterium]|nr:hypothetical protein [Kiritimatiellia bacterium]
MRYALLRLEDGSLAAAASPPFKAAPSAGTLCLVREGGADAPLEPARFESEEERQGPPPASVSCAFVSFATRAEAARALSNAEEEPKFRRIVADACAAARKELVAARFRFSLRRERLVVTLSLGSFFDSRPIRDAIAAAFSGQIDIRMVPPRVLAASVGGLGQCGLPLCCSRGLRPAERGHGAARRRDVSTGLCNRPQCCADFD